MMKVAELASTFETYALLNAVVGPITEDRHVWRISRLRSLLDAIENGELAVTDKCDDPDAMRDCIAECRDMERAVNAALHEVHPWSND